MRAHEFEQAHGIALPSQDSSGLGETTGETITTTGAAIGTATAADAIPPEAPPDVAPPPAEEDYHPPVDQETAPVEQQPPQVLLFALCIFYYLVN